MCRSWRSASRGLASREVGVTRPVATTPFTCSMFATVARQSGAATAFSQVHKQYVKDIYRRMLRNSLNWNVRRDLWRVDAQRIRAEFEHNRKVSNPRELASLFQRAEAYLEQNGHPDPYRRAYFTNQPRPAREAPSGSATFLCVMSTYQPRLFTDEEKSESLKDQHV